MSVVTRAKCFQMNDKYCEQHQINMGYHWDEKKRDPCGNVGMRLKLSNDGLLSPTHCSTTHIVLH